MAEGVHRSDTLRHANKQNDVETWRSRLLRRELDAADVNVKEKDQDR
jgi:hypothetical protein